MKRGGFKVTIRGLQVADHDVGMKLLYSQEMSLHLLGHYLYYIGNKPQAKSGR